MFYVDVTSVEIIEMERMRRSDDERERERLGAGETSLVVSSCEESIHRSNSFYPLTSTIHNIGDHIGRFESSRSFTETGEISTRRRPFRSYRLNNTRGKFDPLTQAESVTVDMGDDVSIRTESFLPESVHYMKIPA